MGQRTFVHATLDWGNGIEVTKKDKSSVLFFEKAGEKLFVIDKALATGALKEVTLPPAEVTALATRAAGRKPKAAAASGAKKKAAAKARKVGLFASVAEQVKLFEALFPGGFTGDAFIKDERGAPGATGPEGQKEAGVALVRSLLSAQAFSSEPPEKLFERALQLLKQTTIAHPIFEGHIPFGSIAEGERAAAMAALKDVLHGTGDYAERLARFAAALTLRDKKGTARKVSWPLVTVFGALFDPAQHVAVKPTAFLSQAATLGVNVAEPPKLDAAGYALFLSVALKTRDALLAAGQQPRDLLDVASFIGRTHAHKAKQPAA